MNSGGLAVMLICEGRLFSEEIGSSYNTCEFCEYVRIRANNCEYLREYLRIHLRIHLQKKKHLRIHFGERLAITSFALPPLYSCLCLFLAF